MKVKILEEMEGTPFGDLKAGDEVEVPDGWGEGWLRNGKAERAEAEEEEEDEALQQSSGQAEAAIEEPPENAMVNVITRKKR